MMTLKTEHGHRNGRKQSRTLNRLRDNRKEYLGTTIQIN